MTNSVLANEELQLKEIDWRIINDSVMGGISRSQVDTVDNFIRFSGNVSLENNGGFASIRAMNSSLTKNLSGISIKVRGDGKKYQFRLRVDGYFDGPAFVASFDTKHNEWQVFHFSTDDFELQYRGRKFSSRYQLNFNDITTVGFLISNKQSGDFVLDIAEIEFDQ